MIIQKIIFLTLIVISGIAHSQEIGRFSMSSAECMDGSPVYVDLGRFNYNSDRGDITLFEYTPEGEFNVPCQPEYGISARLWFIPGESKSNAGYRDFIIRVAEETPVGSKKEAVKMEKGHKDLKIIAQGRQVLNYRFATTYPPEGVDPLYMRSGYIHPLWSPGGEPLTSVQPADHYHHYGIWGPWTLTHIDGRETDFWNLVKGEGTVRFAGFISQVEGEVYSGFKVLQQHIDFGAAGEDRIAINELLDVRVWNISDKVWIIDYTTTFNTPWKTEMLDAYR